MPCISPTKRGFFASSASISSNGFGAGDAFACPRATSWLESSVSIRTRKNETTATAAKSRNVDNTNRGWNLLMSRLCACLRAKKKTPLAFQYRVKQLAKPRGAEGLQRHLCPALQDKLRDELPGDRREENAVAEVACRHVDVLLLRKRSDDRQIVRRARPQAGPLTGHLSTTKAGPESRRHTP